MNTHRAMVGIALFGALLALAGLSPDRGFTQTPLYQGKTITIIAGTAPGGIGDNRVKSIVPFLRKYIPGIPPSWSSTWTEAVVGRSAIICTAMPVPTGSRSERSAVASSD